MEKDHQNGSSDLMFTDLRCSREFRPPKSLACADQLDVDAERALKRLPAATTK